MAIKEGWTGRFFEDFELGDVYRSRLGRTVTDADNILFTLMSNNSNQIHFNAEYARHAGYPGMLVNSIVTLSVVAGLGVTDLSENGFALGWDYIKLPNPVFAGDTLHTEQRVIELRESRSRPQQGIVKVRTLGIKQDCSVVIDYARSVMVWKRAFAPARAAFPEPNIEQ
jgi:itaconyl-CoA hydratase